MSRTPSMNILTKYKEEVKPKLKEEFGIKNDLALPQMEKIVLNMGVAEAITSHDILEKVKDQLTQITGQKPKVARAKRAISNFKLKKNDPIGVMVTLRRKRAWQFLEKLIAIVMPRMRDFRGLTTTKFDKFGNYSLGLSEQIIFPEVDYAKIDKVRGLVVTIVVKNSDQKKSQRLFELLGLPFKK
ncbi:50S ribosomal protein L5 [Candidatus Curtissbacteria bacterium RIFCSPHIGHO2_01_FULL_41_44]|uniref:Large ribosomal subunit protein uL5 n=1 Tax=Candidatus Curtissbacteria bacterium RIFCSPLOWO2_01_FULL_42_50 TaxID=1797730 RepID=A0A1F5H2G9_9BACT|nr:MAG: 50S ribosomal protein L5 [Candidatus Curtissbacteria bacterium RIFCSPHIGHO2_02_FULL_42_58]OGD94760.1 MAG: 50S ribosomal protein L5 [Candidatus Curtissbacteria bacterium RIFCSPHIGHO2_01_FULL_41_44]OGD96304.1 MAG: 50S ribosomal protein L5 [Candidatus Curtissbacteria bacterium RIFCSPHIGHO2_12_FULL_42_33]OGD98323.1 MAG: 50S ribosomal protein L5 [Candidatus Curtissbacteria bacterium RIFCSPLOWO2_01_FULL_42_50]OGE02960.1 MAG: 50S ribosomal protein L5 [Candidatus Curtissbacteria bacterium RIFCS